jgi:uncharacterized membrane protein YbhN (UPF0104 family)
MVPSLVEIALSVGGYYLLRGLHMTVFWALTIPAVAVAAVAVVATVRRRRTDMIGALVLAELAITIALSLITRSARVAAVREPLYVLAAGMFCLITLLQRRPLTDRSTARLASFGDPRRKAAFDYAWRHVAEYRRWQRLLTAAIGLIMVISSAIRVGLVVVAPGRDLAHAIDVSNTAGLLMLLAIGLTGGMLIQPPRRIIEELLTGNRLGLRPPLPPDQPIHP